MIGAALLVGASAGVPGSDDALPRFGLGTAVHLDVRGSLGLTEACQIPRYDARPMAVGLSATVMAGGGLTWLRAEAGLHLGGGLTPTEGDMEGRIEPRVAVRAVTPRLHASFGAGLAVDSGGQAPTLSGSLVWLAAGERVRPALTVDVRVATEGRSATTTALTCDCDPRDFLRFRQAGGTGVLLGVGVYWSDARERVGPVSPPRREPAADAR